MPIITWYIPQRNILSRFFLSRNKQVAESISSMPKVAAASSVCGVNGRGKTWRAAAPGTEAPSLPLRFPLPQRLLLLLPRPVPPPAAARVGSLRRQGRRGRRRDRLLRPRPRLSGPRRSPRVRVQRVLLRRRLLPVAARLPRRRRQVRRPFPILHGINVADAIIQISLREEQEGVLVWLNGV